MSHNTQTITLPSGIAVEYNDFVNAGLYLDLQNVPEALAGTRIRVVAKGLIVSFGGDTTREGISKKVEEMNLKDLGELSKALLKVVQKAEEQSADDKKKSDEPVSGDDAGQGDNDPENADDRGTA